MVRVPLRGAPVPLGSTANCTFPEPEPDAPSVIVIHAAPLTALHGHPPAVETETVPTPPDPGMVTALRLNVQPLSCMTVTVRAATVTAPLRAGPVLAATERSNVPLPLPPADPVTPIHPALLTAVHAQDAAAATSTRAPPPVAGAGTASGDTTNEQPVSCSTVNA